MAVNAWGVDKFKEFQANKLLMAQLDAKKEKDYSEGMYRPGIDAGDNIVEAPESTQSQNYLDYSEGMFTPDTNVVGSLAAQDTAINAEANAPPVNEDPSSIEFYTTYAPLLEGQTLQQRQEIFAMTPAQRQEALNTFQEDQKAEYGNSLVDAAFNDAMINSVGREEWNTYSGDVRTGFQERLYKYIDNYDRWGSLDSAKVLDSEAFAKTGAEDEIAFGGFDGDGDWVPGVANYETSEGHIVEGGGSYYFEEGSAAAQHQQNVQDWGAPEHKSSFFGSTVNRPASDKVTNMQNLFAQDEAAITGVQTGAVEQQLPQDSRGMIQQTVDEQASRLSRNSGFRGSIYTGDSGLTEMAAKKPWKRLGGAG